MPDSITAATQKHRIATGVRRDKYGWEAYVKVDGQQFAKRFHPDTPLNVVRLWRSQKRAEARGVLHATRIHRAFKPIKPMRRSIDGWCYVYIIQDGDMVKIGKAVHPMERLKSLQTGHSRPLALVAAIPAHADLERALHRRFDNLRLPGTEWFRLAPEMETFIDHVRQGKNPVALLW